MVGDRTLSDGRNARPAFQIMAERYMDTTYAPDNVAEAYDNATANRYIPYVSRRPLDRLTDTPPPGLPD